MNIHKLSINIVVAALLILICGSVLTSYVGSKDVHHRVCLHNYCFNVELAVTEPERKKGLMFRDYLAKDSGMFFVYKNADVYPFWMKNTKIPLDIIWIDAQGKIVFIKENVPPCGQNKCVPVYPDKPAKYVLEVNSGSVRRIGLELKDKLSFYNIP